MLHTLSRFSIAFALTVVLVGTPERGGAQCQLAKLTPDDPADYLQFGVDVSLGVDFVAIGAPESNRPPPGPGCVYIFRRDDHGTPNDSGDDTWTQHQKLAAHDPSSGAAFGQCTILRADHLLVGAPNDDEVGARAGAVYVFYRDRRETLDDPSDDLWVEQTKLVASTTAPGDWFGYTLAFEGDYLVVGAGSHDAFGPDSGAAYVFRHDDRGTPDDPSDDRWVEQAELVAEDGAAGDMFGDFVGSNSRAELIAISAFNTVAGGAVYLFRRDDHGTPNDPNDDTWVQQAKVVPNDQHPGQSFGYGGLSCTEEHLLVGSPDDSPLGSRSGSAYVFYRDQCGTPNDPSDDVWVQQARLLASNGGDGDQFGMSALLTGRYAIVGAYEHWVLTAGTGQVYISWRDDCGTPADPSDDTWSEAAVLTAADGHNGDCFGRTLTAEGDLVATGAIFDSDQAYWGGSAYIFRPFGGMDCNHNGIRDTCESGTTCATGDLNCDGAVDFDDIDPFVLALMSETKYRERYPNCDPDLADVNRDNSVDFDDIDPFVACLVNGGCR